MRLLTIVVVSTAALALTLAAAADFETPPDEEPTASLPASKVAGEYFHIDTPVHSDGLMHHYVIDSRFGSFPAYGRAALTVRLSEVAALASIAKTSDTDVALQSVGRSLHENADAVLDLARNPVRAVTGVPRGIGHLFGGYRAQAEELSGEVHKDLQPRGNSPRAGNSVAKESSAQAKKYLDRYFGLSAAQMRWYQKLGVDPYTSNEVLRNAVKHLAKVDATARFGMHFVPVAGIPYAGELRRALNAIYNEDPAVLRKRRREALAGFGLAADEAERFQNAILLSPTRQTVLVEAVQALEGVADRAELLRHASTVTSEEEIEVFLYSTELLLHFHAQQPVARIVAGVRLPTAQLADGRVVVFGAFDALYWSEEVAGYESSVEQLLPSAAAARELWLAGSVSARARQGLEQRGWHVHERME